MVVQSKEGKKTLIGILSHSNTCLKLGDLGVYTRISPYMFWIQRVIQSNGTTEANLPEPSSSGVIGTRTAINFEDEEEEDEDREVKPNKKEREDEDNEKPQQDKPIETTDKPKSSDKITDKPSEEDSKEEYMYFDKRSMSPREIVVVNHVLKQLINLSPEELVPTKDQNETSVTDHVSVNGVRVWGRAVCRPGQVLCRECIQQLAKDIIRMTDNGRGAQWSTKECFLRYEFYHFE